MRIKVTTSPPLPPLKAWFPIPPTHGSTSSTVCKPTVASFKSHLCSSLPVLRGFAPASLCLSIDGFQLLDDSELEVVRDGDLVWSVHRERMPSPHKLTNLVLKRYTHPDMTKLKSLIDRTPPPYLKQHRPQNESEPFPIRPIQIRPTQIPLKHLARHRARQRNVTRIPLQNQTLALFNRTFLQNLCHVEPATGPSLSPSAPRNPRMLPFHLFLFFLLKFSSLENVVNVPPGFGKPQTRARNRRRRIKRQHECEAIAASRAAGSGANAIGLPEVTRSTTPQEERMSYEEECADWPETPDDPLLSLPSLSLRNKNKAKNFRAFFGKPLPPKIIFTDETGTPTRTPSESAPPADAQPVTTLSIFAAAEPRRAARILPFLIPPSSRPSLPSNLFVTSVDLEANLQRPKKKRKMQAALEYSARTEEHKYDTHVQTEHLPRQHSHDDTDNIEQWADAHWTELRTITRDVQLNAGNIVAYKVSTPSVSSALTNSCYSWCHH